MKKAGRNDPCPCGSGKKFKKCCETKMLRGRFSVEPLSKEGPASMKKSGGITTLFQSIVQPSSPKTSHPEKKENNPSPEENI